MATQPSNDTSEPLKYRTWVLKVSIHCEGCKKKVHKILHNIDGVFTVSIDSQENKVTVTGNVEAEKLVKKLEKAGKHAEILQEQVAESETKTGKSKKKKNKNKTSATNPDNVEKGSGNEGDDQDRVKIPEEKEKDEKHDKPEENDAENEKPDPANAGATKKKKKKKGKKGNDAEGPNPGDAPPNTESLPAGTIDLPVGMMHLGPPFGHVYSYPAPYYPAPQYPAPHYPAPHYPAQSFGMSYSTTHPSITSSYYALPARYPPSGRIHMYENMDRDEVYVDNDGEGGCSIM